MALTVEQLAQQAMELPPADRADLAERVMESIDFSSSEELQQLWSVEANRRLEDLRSGRVQPIPAEEVLAEVRRIVGR